METVIEPTKLITWTDERIDQLKRLFDDGLSGSGIAGLLGITRNAVIGKLHRMGLQKPRISNCPKMVTVKGRSEPAFRARPSRKYLAAETAAVVVPLCIELVDLEKHHCRFPYGDGPYTFCGHHKQSGSSYCPPHFALTWQPARVRA